MTIIADSDPAQEADWLPAVWVDEPAERAIARADELAELGDRIRAYVTASKAPNTLRAYRSDWVDFTGWCDARGLESLPASPGTVAAYLSDLTGVAGPRRSPAGSRASAKRTRPRATRTRPPAPRWCTRP